MIVRVIAVGKLREKSWADACAQYEKRLSRFCTLQMIELREAAADDGDAASRRLAVRREGEDILKRLREGDVLVALDVRGEQMDSPAFAEFLAQNRDMGRTLVFAIGGSYGLGDQVLERAQVRLSLSRMTFAHQMVRPFLLEQLYRGFSILAGHPYHK